MGEVVQQAVITMDQILEGMDQLVSKVHAVREQLVVVAAEMNALREKIAGGGLVTQAQLDHLSTLQQQALAEADAALTQVKQV